MRELFNKYKVYLFIGLALLVALIFYSLNLKNRETFNPAGTWSNERHGPGNENWSSAGNGLISDIWSDYLNLVNVRKENKELQRIIKIYSCPRD